MQPDIPALKNPHAPPEWSRQRMAQTGLLVFAAIVLATGVLYMLLTASIRQRKVDQKAERAVRDLTQNQAMLKVHQRLHNVLPVPTGDNALPEEFSSFFAEQRGGQPLYQEQGRVARLDVFATRPYGEPLGYFVRDDRWVLVSRGPDHDLDIDSEVMRGDDAMELLITHSYDPTNGAESSGDIWVSNHEQ